MSKSTTDEYLADNAKYAAGEVRSRLAVFSRISLTESCLAITLISVTALW